MNDIVNQGPIPLDIFHAQACCLCKTPVGRGLGKTTGAEIVNALAFSPKGFRGLVTFYLCIGCIENIHENLIKLDHSVKVLGQDNIVPMKGN